MVKFNWRKKVAKALVFAMAMGTVGTHAWSTQVPMAVMAEASKIELTVQYDEFTATIKSSNSTDKYVFLEVLKGDSADSKVSATYVYELPKEGTKQVIVPLSFLSPKKEQYIRAYGDSDMEDKSDVYKIAAQPAKEAIKFVVGKDKVPDSFSISEKINDYEFKSLYGSSWTPFVKEGTSGSSIQYNFDLATTAVAGSTIVVRKKAVAATASAAGAPAGVEIKVKIPASPKAPKVAVDYVKGTIKLPKGTQYKATGDETWIENSAATTLSLQELRKNINDNGKTFGTQKDDSNIDPTKSGNGADKAFTILVRTKADKKAASIPAFVAIGQLDRIESSNPSNDDAHFGGEVKVKVGGATSADDSKKLTYKSTTKGVELKAEGVAFEYYDSNKQKWNTIAAGRSVNVAIADQTQLKVRRAGIKATKDASGAFASLEAQLPKIKITPASVTITGNNECTVGDTVTLTMKAVDGSKKEITPIAADAGNNLDKIFKDEITWKINGTPTTTGVSSDKKSLDYATSAEGTVKVEVTFRNVTGSFNIKVQPKASGTN